MYLEIRVCTNRRFSMHGRKVVRRVADNVVREMAA